MIKVINLNIIDVNRVKIFMKHLHMGDFLVEVNHILFIINLDMLYI